MLVQCVKQTVREAPEEEEDSDQANGHQRLLQGQLGSLCALLVRRPQGAVFPELAREHLGGVVNVFVGRYLGK